MRSLLVLLLLAAPAAPRVEAVVSLRPTAEVSGAVYRLGDLAQVTCPDADRQEKLRATIIARTPAPHRIVRITRSGLRSILEARDVGPVRLGGAQSVSIRTRLASFDAERIRGAARAFLESVLGDLPGRELAFVETDPTVRAMEVPAGSDATRLVADYTDGPRSRGQVRVTVRAVSDGLPLDARVVTFLVHVRESVLVLAQDVRAGESLEPECVESRVVDVTDGTDDLLRTLPELRRAVALRALAAGTPIRESLIRRLPDVRRGDLVDIVYRRGALEVRVSGFATSTGRRGAVVTATNSSSQRTVSGRVVGPGLIEVGPDVSGGEK